MAPEADTSFRKGSTAAEDGGMYAIILDYTASLDQIDQHLDEHIVWLDRHYAEGTFLASGPREPRTGGIILTIDMPLDQVRALADSDPFARHDLATHTLIRFHPSKLADPLTNLAQLLS